MTDQYDFRALERAATIMTDMLPKQARDLIIELADLQYRIPRWHIVAGSMLRLFEEGRNSDYVTEPHWGHEHFEPEPVICKECSTIFTPDRLGQIFCKERCAHLNAGMIKERTQDADPKSELHPDVDDLDAPTDDTGSDLSDDPDPTPTLDSILEKSAEIALKEIGAG